MSSSLSDDAVAAVLPVLRRENDPRLPQYVVYLHDPRGWSLRELATTLNCSHEWVRLLEMRGRRQLASGDMQDISALPTKSARKRKGRNGPSTYIVDGRTAAALRRLSAKAQEYRPGKPLTDVRAFNKRVVELMERGVPMSAIAVAVQQNDRSFRRRMSRWNIRSNEGGRAGAKAPNKVVLLEEAARAKEEEEAREAAAVAAEQAARNVNCRWPDCPSKTGGRCIHPVF